MIHTARVRRSDALAFGPLVIAIVVVVAIIVLNALNPSTPVADFRVTASPAPTQGLILVPRTPTPVTPTVTDTPEPTATPNVNATLTATYAPSLTPTPRATPTRTPRPTSNATSTPTPTPTPIVALIYSRVLLRAPTSNSTVDPTVKVQMTWLLPNVPELRSDERFRLHVWQDQKVIFEKLTSDSWYDWYGGPNGELGTFQWSVSVVRVDDVGEVLGLLSPESETWNITWKTK